MSGAPSGLFAGLLCFNCYAHFEKKQFKGNSFTKIDHAFLDKKCDLSYDLCAYFKPTLKHKLYRMI